MDSFTDGEIIIKDNSKFLRSITDSSDYIYAVLFYVAGLLIGSLCYHFVNSTAMTKVMQSAFEKTGATFEAVFLNRFCLYFSVFTVTVMLGMCLIGFPFINIIPLLTGTEIALKTAYFYVNYSVKGIGYSLLMIIPEGAAFATVLIFTIRISMNLSKNIYTLTSGHEGDRVDIKYFLKKYLLYGAIVAAIALVNALAAFLLSAIISL